MKLLIFDMDGTVVDSMPALTRLATETISGFFNMSPRTAAQKYAETVGRPFKQQLEAIFPDVRPDRILQAARHYDKQHLRLAPTFPLGQQVERVMCWLKNEGYFIALVSSTAVEIINEMKQLQPLQFDWIGGFEGYDKAVQITNARTALRADREDTIYFGDSVKDAEYATTAMVSFTFCMAEHFDVSVFKVIGEPR